MQVSENGVANWTSALCEAERDRVTAAEICLDELLTIMDRHRGHGRMYDDLRGLSLDLHEMLTRADGVRKRRDRLLKVRRALTEAFPLTDADLEATP